MGVTDLFVHCCQRFTHVTVKKLRLYPLNFAMDLFTESSAIGWLASVDEAGVEGKYGVEGVNGVEGVLRVQGVAPIAVS